MTWKWKIGSLFSGIGGLELGLERAIPNAEVVWQVEPDPFCRRVLEQHWPNADRSILDVHDAGAGVLEPVHILCGGFPCQDLSGAGKGEGLTGSRSGLWWQYARVIDEMGPMVVVVENVNQRKRILPGVLGALADIGYDAEWGVLSAAGVGAPHIRRRLFLIAYPNSERLRQLAERGSGRWEGELPWKGKVESLDYGSARGLAHGDEDPYSSRSGRVLADRPQNGPSPYGQESGRPSGLDPAAPPRRDGAYSDSERCDVGTGSSQDSSGRPELANGGGEGVVPHSHSKPQREPRPEAPQESTRGDPWVDFGIGGGGRAEPDPSRRMANTHREGELQQGRADSQVGRRAGHGGTSPSVDRGHRVSSNPDDAGRLEQRSSVTIPTQLVAAERCSGRSSESRLGVGPDGVSSQVDRHLGGVTLPLKLCQGHVASILEERQGLRIPWEILRAIWGYDETNPLDARAELVLHWPDLAHTLDHHPPPPCSACWADFSWENGIPRTVSPKIPNRVARLRALGNAVVPQVAERLGWRVRQILEYGPGPYD